MKFFVRTSILKAPCSIVLVFKAKEQRDIGLIGKKMALGSATGKCNSLKNELMYCLSDIREISMTSLAKLAGRLNDFWQSGIFECIYPQNYDLIID